MYTIYTEVPRITEEQKDDLLAVVPELETLVKIPVLKTEEEATKFITDKLNRELDRDEVVHSVDEVNMSRKGDTWDFVISISGD
jgi:hypothetical protein